jgi:dephospho-CoA kinase
VPSRQTLQEVGEEVNKNQGQRWLGNNLLKMLPDQKNLVIDGLRFPEDHAFFVEKFGPAFLHIYIDAPEDLRIERYVSQGFERAQFINGISHPVESKVTKLSTLAHTVIENKKSMKSFEAEIIRSISRIKNTSQGSIPCQ